MVDHVVGIIRVFRAAVLIHEPGQSQTRTQINQHRLEPTHVTIRFNHRPTNGIRGGICLANWTIQQADTIVTFKVCCVRQDQIGIGHHFRTIGIGIDDARNDIFAVLILIRQHIHDGICVHRTVPAHVRHVHEQCVDLVRIACMSI